jgi:hypothetical protein
VNRDLREFKANKALRDLREFKANKVLRDHQVPWVKHQNSFI